MLGYLPADIKCTKGVPFIKSEARAKLRVLRNRYVQRQISGHILSETGAIVFNILRLIFFSFQRTVLKIEYFVLQEHTWNLGGVFCTVNIIFSGRFKSAHSSYHFAAINQVLTRNNACKRKSSFQDTLHRAAMNAGTC